MRHFLFFALFSLLLGCGSSRSSRPFEVPKETRLYHSVSELKIEIEDLIYWDQIAAGLLEKSPPKRSGDGYRLWAYLTCAQKAFADASFKLSSAYSGSIDSISLAVIHLFYPNYQNDDLKTDSYSKELSALLMGQIKDRFNEEERQIRPFEIPEKDDLWRSDTPPADRYIPSMKPWVLKNNSEFQSPRPPKPDDPKWNDQLAVVKNYKSRATDAQKKRSFAWQDQTPSNGTDWRDIAQKYMREKNIPLEMQLHFREKYNLALMDALIAVYYDKFTYMVERPIMKDPNFKPLFTTPNHPSYPSAHSTLAGTAGTILCYFFPENEAKWHELAKESGISRLWAGIHYPMDNEAGMDQGNQVGKAVLFR